jgi:hypothetical protein
MENARRNRKKGRKNADFFAGMWKSPLKMQVARGPGMFGQFEWARQAR